MVNSEPVAISLMVSPTFTVPCFTRIYLRSGAACRGKCGEVECPVYTPDFMKLADAYGAKGIHITKKEEIEPAFREAMKSTKTPYILEFDIDPEDLVYPMVKPGGTLEDLIMDC